jgi:hypothetical protein
MAYDTGTWRGTWGWIVIGGYSYILHDGEGGKAREGDIESDRGRGRHGALHLPKLAQSQ